jgi:hypothetical protein
MTRCKMLPCYCRTQEALDGAGELAAVGIEEED